MAATRPIGVRLQGEAGRHLFTKDVVMLSHPGQSDSEAAAVLDAVAAQVAARARSSYAPLGAMLRMFGSAPVRDHFDIEAPNLLAFAPERNPVVVPSPGGRTDVFSLRTSVYL